MKRFNIKKLKFINVNRKKKTTETIYLFGERVSSSIGRTLVACFGIIGFFYVAPIFINFANHFTEGTFKQFISKKQRFNPNFERAFEIIENSQFKKINFYI